MKYVRRRIEYRPEEEFFRSRFRVYAASEKKGTGFDFDECEREIMHAVKCGVNYFIQLIYMAK